MRAARSWWPATGPMLLLASVACAATPAPEIRIAEAFDTPTSVPGHRTRNTTSDQVMLHVVESLVALRADLTVAPMLADSWTVSPDGKTYQFTLRPGLTFHNGAPVSAAEVVWSMKRLLDPASESYCRTQYNGSKGAHVLNVEAGGERVVRFELAAPNALFLQQMASVQCPLAILHPASVDAQGKWQRPVATGPYAFGEWRKGQYITLAPYAGYRPRSEAPSGMAGAKRALAPLRIVIIPDPAAQKLALMSGQVDLIVTDPDNPPPPGPGWDLLAQQDLDLNLLLMQPRDALLGRAPMRKALALSLDLPLLARALSNGAAPYNPSLVPLASRAYSPVHARGYRKDAAAAARLLAAAGYRGEPIRIQTNRRYPEMYRLAVLAQGMLRQAGIRAEVEVLEWATQASNFREGKFQMMAFSYSARLDPAVMYADVLGDSGAAPMSQWSSAPARAQLAAISAIGDPAQRKAAFEAIHRQMIDDVPLIQVYNSPVLLAVSRRLDGFQPWPLRRPRLFNVSKR